MPLLETRGSGSAVAFGFNSFTSLEVFDSIFSYTVGAGGISSVNIPVPSGYKSLHLRLVHRTNRSGALDGLKLTFNNDTANNYSKQYMYSVTATTGFSQNSQGYIQIDSAAGATFQANTFGVSLVDIMGNSESNKFTTVRNIGGITNDGTNAHEIDWEGGVWASTANVSSIQIAPYLGTLLAQHTRISLYGVKA